MAVVLPNEGAIEQLGDLKALEASYKIRLFKNNFAPVVGSVAADFTVCDFSGYAQVALVDGAIAINGAGKAEMTAAAAVFSHNGGATANTVYGWYIIDTVTNKVRWASLFAAPRTMGAAGDSITVSLVFTLTQG